MPVVAQTQYATTADLYIHGLPAAAVQTISTQNQQAVIDSVSAEFESYADGQYTLPLLKWGIDVVRSICAVAAWELMCVRGFNPEGVDTNYSIRASAARKWWAAIAEGRVTPPTIVDSAQGAIGQEGGPQVTSDVPRGWNLPSSGATAFPIAPADDDNGW